MWDSVGRGEDLEEEEEEQEEESKKGVSEG